MPTHYNVKMKMLYALAICGLVRRDDLAIFSETMNAGSHDIMDLISAGFVKESSAEVDIRIGGRSRKRVRRVCCITNKGLAFLLEFGGGEEGVKCYIDKLAGELADTMQMCGAHSLAEITPDMVRV